MKKRDRSQVGMRLWIIRLVLQRILKVALGGSFVLRSQRCLTLLQVGANR
ncbi:MAG TPA: hypothetical protein VGG72_27905 [Bryobacteraceae bacterium]